MKISAEPERLNARVPLAFLAISVVIIVLSVVLTLAVRSLGRREPPPGGLALTPPAGADVVSVGTEPVQAAWLFESGGVAPSTRRLPRRLGEYGWVDRERGIVRIPLARAKQLYLERLQLAPAPAAPPPITAPASQRGLQ